MQGGCKEEPAYSFRRACPSPLQTELCQWPLGKTTQSAVNRGFTTHKLPKALSVLPLNQSTFWVRTLFGGFQSHLAFSSRVHFPMSVTCWLDPLATLSVSKSASLPSNTE